MAIVKTIKIPLESAIENMDMDTLAYRKWWSLYDVINNDNEFYQTKYTSKSNSLVHFIDDTYICVKYVIVNGEHHEDVEKLERDIRKMFPSYDLERVKRELSENVVDRIFLTHVASLCATEEFEKEFFDFYCAEFLDGNDDKEPAVIGMGYIGWREFMPKLQAILDDENELEVNTESAQRMLDAFNNLPSS